MGNAKTVYENIYLFVVEQQDGKFAKFRKVYQRNPTISRAEAVAEVQRTSLPVEWGTGETPPASGLDMQLKDEPNVLVLVHLPGPNSINVTEFGKDVVKDLAVEVPKKNNSLVQNAERHSCKDQNYRLCSFEINIKAILDELGRSPGGHTIDRLPIVFDFIDTADGTSPVLKSPRHNFGHGGIHPPTGSSTIIVDG